MLPITSIRSAKTSQNSRKLHLPHDWDQWRYHCPFTWKWVFSIWKRATHKVTSLRNHPRAAAVKKESSASTVESRERTQGPRRWINASRGWCEFGIKE